MHRYFYMMLIVMVVIVNFVGNRGDGQDFGDIPEKISPQMSSEQLKAVKLTLENERAKLRSFMATASVEQLEGALEKPFPSKYSVKWSATKENDEDCLLDEKYLRKNAFMYYARGDALLATAMAPRFYWAHQYYLRIWEELMKRNANHALAWVGKLSNETPPTLLHANVAGFLLLQVRRVEVGAVEMHPVNLFKPEHVEFWKDLLSSRNPIFLSTALQLAGKFETGVSLTEAIGHALKSEWVSLQFISLETAESIKPPGVKRVIEEYLKLNRTGIPEEVAKQLDEKAQSALKALAYQK